MTGHEEANLGTIPVRPGYEVDLAALTEWLQANVSGFLGPVQIEQFKGGQSNPTYRLATPSGNYVLRRKPPGETLKGAHAVDREARVLLAVGSAGLPVPKVHAVCMDETIIGSVFYVMDMVEGRIFWDAKVPGVGKSERRAIYDSMNETIARLHSIDYQAVGLADYGKPGNYFSRQIDRWSRQYRADEEAGREPILDRVIDWLEENLPQGDDQNAIIHGDFRIDNLIFHPIEARVVAVLDWELSTLGHPLADFAYNVMMYRMPPHIVAGLADADLEALGIPQEDAYVAAYCRRTGRSSIPNLDYYIAFNFFRLAAIFHGIKGRVIRGTATNLEAQARVKVLPELIELAWQQALRAKA